MHALTSFAARLPRPPLRVALPLATLILTAIVLLAPDSWTGEARILGPVPTTIPETLLREAARETVLELDLASDRFLRPSKGFRSLSLEADWSQGVLGLLATPEIRNRTENLLSRSNVDVAKDGVTLRISAPDKAEAERGAAIFARTLMARLKQTSREQETDPIHAKSSVSVFEAGLDLARAELAATLSQLESLRDGKHPKDLDSAFAHLRELEATMQTFRKENRPLTDADYLLTKTELENLRAHLTNAISRKIVSAEGEVLRARTRVNALTLATEVEQEPDASQPATTATPEKTLTLDARGIVTAPLPKPLQALLALLAVLCAAGTLFPRLIPTLTTRT